MLRRFFSTRGGGVVGERVAPAMSATTAALVGVARPTTTHALAWGGASAVYGMAPLQYHQQLRLRSSSSSSPIRRRHHASSSAAALAHRRGSNHGGASSRRSRVVSSASKRSPSSAATTDRATEIQRRYSRDAASGPTASLGLRVHEEISARYAVAAALQRADSQQAAAAAPTPSATGSNPIMDVTLEGTDSHRGVDAHYGESAASDGPAVVSEDGGTIVRKQPQKLTEKQAGRWVDERLQEAAMFRDPRP